MLFASTGWISGKYSNQCENMIVVVLPVRAVALFCLYSEQSYKGDDGFFGTTALAEVGTGVGGGDVGGVLICCSP